ncbi:MAG: thiamine phosphate synthase [Bacteroidales bacterium]|jgi:thiamine-phosphate pyrophosphorylase|nr:thiamine phosphate synthase [Bacteroidales bacterium]
MKLMVITADTLFDNEPAVLNRLFRAGMDVLHLRKPLAAAGEVERLLLRVDAAYHPRIVLHDHFALLPLFPLQGVHLNSRHPAPPRDVLPVSRSCHSLACLEHAAGFRYAFLSPVFDSISKTGYAAAFTPEELQSAAAKGLIGDRVIALGGINATTIPIAAAYGFGGVAVLGALWGRLPEDGDETAVVRRFEQLQSITAS